MAHLYVAEMQSGEVISISTINKDSIKALKQHIALMIETYDWDCKFKVLDDMKGTDPQVNKWFADYIKYKIHKEHQNDMLVVGVYNKRLEQKCYEHNSIRPLHIAQGLMCTIENWRTAVRDDDEDFLWDVKEEKISLYNEARKTYGMSMTEINSLAWGEYHIEIQANHKLQEYDYNKKFAKTYVCTECQKEFKSTVFLFHCNDCSQDIFDAALEDDDDDELEPLTAEDIEEWEGRY
jgi:hypothetical protein